MRRRPVAATDPPAESIVGPARAIPWTPEELALACAPMSVEGDPELTEARVPARDTLEAWTVRMRDVCPHCGLRKIDGDGKCGGCGGRKAK